MTQVEPPGVEAVADSDFRQQFAALCFSVTSGKTRVLLITSRGTGRWIVPKGWFVEGSTAAGSAAREAWEEAGVVGRIYDTCLGTYRYMKIEPKKADIPCRAQIFPVKVLSLKGDYPERHQRRRKWFSPKKAAELVDEPELAEILRRFDPGALQPLGKS
ncbi:MAG: NUDIX hydrolase [Pseudooceanicola sp.]|nr:NUDIX hydrolase [Pseudooceanicola sp.]